jgi:hypothetical protein
VRITRTEFAECAAGDRLVLSGGAEGSPAKGGRSLGVDDVVVSFLRSSRAIRGENLVLRKQLASYIERGIKPRRVDHATWVSLALFSRLFDWRDAVVIVPTSTIVRWQRLG